MKKEAYEVKAEKVADAANRLIEFAEKMDLEADITAYALVMTASNYIATEEGLEDLIKYLVFSYTMIESIESGKVKL